MNKVLCFRYVNLGCDLGVTCSVTCRISSFKSISFIDSFIDSPCLWCIWKYGSLFGYFLAIASGLTYAFYLVKIDKTGLVKMNALKLSFYLALFTMLEIFTINLFMQDVVFKMDAIAYALLLALSSSFLATVLLQEGVLLLGSTRASFICLLEPVTSMIVGILFLGEALALNKGLGGLAIIISLIIFLKK